MSTGPLQHADSPVPPPRPPQSPTANLNKKKDVQPGGLRVSPGSASLCTRLLRLND